MEQKIRLPDGREVVVQAPDGAPPEKIFQFAKEQYEAGAFGPAPEAEEPKQPREVSAGEALAGLGQGMQMAGMAAWTGAIAGAGKAMTELGQAASDWIAQGADWAGLDGPKERFAKLGDSLEQREQSLVSGAQQLGVDFFESIHGEGTALQVPMGKITDFVADVTDEGTKMLVGGGAAKATAWGAKGFLGAMGKGVVGGTFAGALLGEEDSAEWAERMGNRKLQAAIGAGASGVLAVGQGIFTSGRNALARHIKSTVDNADHNFKLADQYDIDITLGQASGNPVVANIEGQAAGEQAQKFFAKQVDEAGERIAAQLGIKARPLEQVGYGTGLAINDTIKAVDEKAFRMKSARNKAWQDKIKEAVAVHGDQPILRPSDLVKTVEDIIEDIDYNYHATLQPSEALKTLLAEAKLGEQTGWSANQVNKWWRRLNEYKGKGTGLFAKVSEDVDLKDYRALAQKFGGKMSGSLDETIRKASVSASPGGTHAQALRLLGEARTQYKKASGDIAALQNDFVKSLGLVGGPKSILRALHGMDQAQVRKITDHIRKLDGGEAWIEQVREAAYDTALAEGMRAAASMKAARGSVYLPAFADALADTSKRNVLYGLADPKSARYAEEGVDILRVMLNASEQVVPGGVAVKQLPFSLQDVAINAVSRSPEFVTRLFANGVARGHNMEKLFFTKEGIDILRSLRPEMVKFGAMNAKRNAGIAYIASMIGEDSRNETDAKFRSKQMQNESFKGL